MTVKNNIERIEDIVTVCGLDSCMKINALIDSGADKTVISRGIADKIHVLYTGKEIILEDFSGNEIIADEAKAYISISDTACEKEVKILVPRISLPEDGVIIGNDFMKDTQMQIGYHGGPNVSCPKNLRKIKDECARENEGGEPSI